jgi:hypothetical protein
MDLPPKRKRLACNSALSFSMDNTLALIKQNQENYSHMFLKTLLNEVKRTPASKTVLKVYYRLLRFFNVLC